MHKTIIDTNIYIDFLRQSSKPSPLKGLYTFRTSALYFSSVVAEALLLGAVTKKDRQGVSMICEPFDRVGRIVTPTDRDWRIVGEGLSRLRHEKGVSLAKVKELRSDALIAVSTYNIGGVVVTKDKKDYVLLSSVMSVRYEVIL